MPTVRLLVITLRLLVFVCVFACAAVVVLRYGFGVGVIWLQELYVWVYGAIFVLGNASVLATNAHVRVDLCYSYFSPRARIRVEILGAFLFAIPWMAIWLWSSIPFARRSIEVLEGSSNSGGMPGVFVFKALIPIGAAMTLMVLLWKTTNNLRNLRKKP